MADRQYEIQTPKGIVTITAKDITAARQIAAIKHKVTNPRCTTAVRAYKRCSNCDSAPCCC